MPNYICETCGSQFAASEQPPPRCTICDEERQYVNPAGQTWTTLAELQAKHHNLICSLEAGRVTMPFSIVSRPSDSRFVDSIWQSRSDGGGRFMSIAVNQWGLVFSRIAGKLSVELRGPETSATIADCPPEGEWVGVQFKLGVHLWDLPITQLAVTERTARRRFLDATGMTFGSITQIERARYASSLLRSGHTILDTVALAGYADQSHLGRSLRRFVGHTPSQLFPVGDAMQLSLIGSAEP